MSEVRTGRDFPFDEHVQVSPLGQMYATCNVRGCFRSFGQVVMLGCLEFRVCHVHGAELRKGLKS